MNMDINSKSVYCSFNGNIPLQDRFYTYKILAEEIANNNKSSNFGTIEHELRQEKLAQIITQRLERIPAGQRQMFQKYFGLNGYDRLDIYKIAAERNIPWKRVRMWVNLAFHNLQRDKEFIKQLSHFRR